MDPLPRNDSRAAGGVTVALSPIAVATVLGACILVLVAAGIAVPILRIQFGHDYLKGFARLFDLNAEANLPTWYSSSLLLAAAAILIVASRTAAPDLQRHWVLLGAVFTFLSLDEAASLHEMSNAPLRSLFQSGPGLYFPWVILGTAFAAAVALSQRALLKQLPRVTRRLFIVSGAVYVLGAAGFEMLAAPLYAAARHGSYAHAALVCTEETLEMAGAALFVVAVVHYLAQRPPIAIVFDEGHGVLARLRLAPRQVRKTLLSLAIGLAATSLGLQAVHYLGAENVPRLVRLTNLSREGNIPTWFQASVLLACGAAAGLVAVGASRRHDRFRLHWAGVAVAFVYLSADEAAAIHELSVAPLRHALGASGILYYPWVLAGLFVVGIAAVVLRAFLAALPPRTRRTLLVAAAIFCAGALGVEALSGAFAEAHGRNNLGYALITTVEETLEMTGAVLALAGMLEHLRHDVGIVVFGRPVPSESPTVPPRVPGRT